jgi:hypothetical protein
MLHYFLENAEKIIGSDVFKYITSTQQTFYI